MPSFNIGESNGSPETLLAGSVASGGVGFQVVGLAFAGLSFQNVGAVSGFRGIYGTLFLDADGSFNYRLDNNDPDTNALGSGMLAQEVFTYTFTLNGAVSTSRLTFNISGLNEPGQLITSTSTTIDLADGSVINAAERIDASSQFGLRLRYEFNQSPAVRIDGTVLVNSTSFESVGLASEGYFGSPRLVSNGLISAIGHQNSATGIFIAAGTGTLLNNGVIRAFADRARDSVQGFLAGGAIGVQGGSITNNGLIDVASIYGTAQGVQTSFLVNNGVIRVTAPGLPPYSDGGIDRFALVGINGYLSGAWIENRGTIDVSASSATGHSVGIFLFPNSSNVYQSGTIINSGRIIANTAILATGGYSGSLTVINSGYIEGDLHRETGGLDALTNTQGAEWIGNLFLGEAADLIRNDGLIRGNVNLGAGADFFIGSEGIVTGSVNGGAGGDILLGGSGADTLDGGDDADVIHGGGARDQLRGGPGADIFVYTQVSDSTSAARDFIADFETGVDKIDLSALAPGNVAFATADGVTVISGDTAWGPFSIAVAGNATLGDLIIFPRRPTNGSDILLTDGRVQLAGLSGDDVLASAAGNDTLDGGPGADVMYGGAGDDFYLVDNGNDRIMEASGDGHDAVLTSVDYSLQSGIEDGILTGSAPIGILGNGLANRLEGNTADNVLRGGAGDDVLIGGLGSDILEGGGGADRFIYRSAQESTFMQADRLIGFETGIDLIDLGDIGPVTYRFEPRTANWGSDLYAGVISDWTVVTVTTASQEGMLFWVNGRISESDFRTGPSPSGIRAWSDFNGDGRSDVLWQDAAGNLTVWRGRIDGTFFNAGNLAANPLDPSWRVAGLGDFNGDGRSDILWRHTSGTIGEWLGQQGMFANNGGAAANAVDNGWSVVGVADFNGDGRDDVLWRHSSGVVGQWLGQANGSFLNNGGAAANVVDVGWSVAAAGDFNGDGRSDVLWRHASGVLVVWQGTGSGAFTNVGTVMAGESGLVVGSGDFNGDGRDDVLARAANGLLTVWLGQSERQLTRYTPAQQLLDPNWHVASIGDFNGDGRADLMWRHNSGVGGEWLGTAAGDFVYNGSNATMPSGWSIQSPDIFVV